MTAEIDLALALVEKDLGTRWRARWRTASSCTSAVRAANHNIRKCSGWRPSPTASSWRWNMRGATWRSRSASRNWPRRPAESAPVQPRLHGRDRPVARQGRRKAAARSRPPDDRRQSASAGSRGQGNGLSRSAPHARGLPARLRHAAAGGAARGADDALTRHPVRHGRAPHSRNWTNPSRTRRRPPPAPTCWPSASTWPSAPGKRWNPRWWRAASGPASKPWSPALPTCEPTARLDHGGPAAPG